MNLRSYFFWICLTLPLLSFPSLSFALTERLDDSASPQSRVGSQTAWNQQGQLLSPLSTETAVMLKFGRVHYKLATAKYVGKQARIYYVVPASIAGLRSNSGLKIQWEGSGLFGPGFAKPGDKTLVWSGMVKNPWMTEVLDLKMHVDLNEVRLPTGQSLGFESYFEIELLP